MRLGVFAKTFAGTDPLTVLVAAKAAGFAAVQYNMACSGLPALPDGIGAAQVNAIHRANDATGVAVVAVSGTWNMIHPDPAVRADGLRRLEVLARARIAPLITLCTGTRDADDQWRGHPGNAEPAAWSDLLDQMGKALVIAEANGVMLGVEPELANVVNSAAKAQALIAALPSPALRIVLDAANLFETGPLTDQRHIVAHAVDLLGDRIVMAHAKDRDAAGGFVAAGRGVLDYPHYVACLRGVGFSGDLVTHGLTVDEAPGVAAFLRGALA